MHSLHEWLNIEYRDNHPPHWWRHDQNWRACSIGYFGSVRENLNDVVVLSEEGQVCCMGNHDPIIEKIPGAGVYNEDAKGWGYLSDIRQIGDCLYACGYRGQVYKRLGPTNWQHMDEGLLQLPNTSMEESIGLAVINGFHEKAIYAAGYLHTKGLPPKAFFFDGQTWTELPLPEAAGRITNIYVESEARIWMCGDGTLLLGNAKDGFKCLTGADDEQLFYSICKFQDKMYLGSNLGLFMYDPVDHQASVRRVKTDLQPDLQDTNIVDCFKNVLWSIGSKDIARFDGTTWERIHHPDNPRIGETT